MGGGVKDCKEKCKGSVKLYRLYTPFFLHLLLIVNRL